MNGPRGGFQLINKSTQATKESQVKPWWFKDEGLTETMRTLTFHIGTGTQGGGGVNESQKLNSGEPTHRVRVTVNVCDNYC